MSNKTKTRRLNKAVRQLNETVHRLHKAGGKFSVERQRQYTIVFSGRSVNLTLLRKSLLDALTAIKDGKPIPMLPRFDVSISVVYLTTINIVVAL